MTQKCDQCTEKGETDYILVMLPNLHPVTFTFCSKECLQAFATFLCKPVDPRGKDE